MSPTFWQTNAKRPPNLPPRSCLTKSTIGSSKSWVSPTRSEDGAPSHSNSSANVPSPSPNDEPRADRGKSAGMKVLITDGERFLQSLLLKWGYQVVPVS